MAIPFSFRDIGKRTQFFRQKKQKMYEIIGKIVSYFIKYAKTILWQFDFFPLLRLFLAFIGSSA